MDARHDFQSFAFDRQGDGGFAVAAILLAIPARRKIGLGLGILAGMAAVPNLWVHYVPTIIVGSLLIASGVYAARRTANFDAADAPALERQIRRGRR